MKYRKFKDEALGRQCRGCINRTYGFRLVRKDCRYWIYQNQCSCCGEIRHIVVDIALLSRWKIWLRKGKSDGKKSGKG